MGHLFRMDSRVERGERQTYDTPSTLNTKLNTECTCGETAERRRDDPKRDEGYYAFVSSVVSNCPKGKVNEPAISRTNMLYMNFVSYTSN